MKKLIEWMAKSMAKSVDYNMVYLDKSQAWHRKYEKDERFKKYLDGFVAQKMLARKPKWMLAKIWWWLHK